MKKLSTLLLLPALIIATVLCFGIGASASDPLSPTAEIEYMNLAYNNERTYIALTVNSSYTDSQDELGIAIWYDAAVENPSLANADYITQTVRTDSAGTEYFRTRPIATEDYAKPMLIAPIIDMGNFLIIAAQPSPYTVFDYAIARLDDEGVTSEQLSSYKDILLDEDINQSIYGITTSDKGCIGPAEATFSAGKVGDTVLLRAEAKNADGEYFLYWQSGSETYTDRVFNATVKAGISSYTAVYGDKADSVYKYTYDFEAHDTGIIDLGKPQGLSSENSSYKGKYYWRVSGSSLGLALYNGFSASGNKYPFTDSTVTAKDAHEITEAENGDKALVIDKAQSTCSYTDTVANPAEDGVICNAVEADVILHGWSTNNPIRLSFAYKKHKDDSVSNAQTISINPTVSGDGFFICLDGARDIKTPIYKYSQDTDSIFTVKYELVTVELTEEGEAKAYLGVNVYLDGILATEAPFVTSIESEEGAEYSITSFHIFQFVNQVGKCTVDNVTFFEQEKEE